MFDLSGYIKKLEKQDVKPIETATAKAIKEVFPKSYKKPYINEHNTLVIPFDTHPKYHYWRGGQHVVQTLLELEVSEEILGKYCGDWRQVTKESLNGTN